MATRRQLLVEQLRTSLAPQYVQLGLLVEQLRVLANLARWRARELGRDGRNIAGTDFPALSLSPVTTEADPHFQPGIEVVLAVERQKLFTAVRPLEALGVEGEGATGGGYEEGAAVRVHGVAGDLRRRCRTAGAARRRPFSRTTQRRCRTAAGRRGTRCGLPGTGRGAGYNRRRRRGG
jgi:hypothetical protein